MNPIIEQKIKSIPDKYVNEISDFLDFLQFKASSSESKLKKRNPGIAKGKLWMSKDFDDTPEDFKEYM